MRNRTWPLILLLVSGCSSTHPYIEARHTSDPTIHNDGWNDMCAGAIYRYKQIYVKGGACNNVTGYRGTRFDGSIMWVIE
jgi:hypothetical protein